ncbi:MAG: family 16 glycosylhydrolase [Chitinophagaceae bacterium]
MNRLSFVFLLSLLVIFSFCGKGKTTENTSMPPTNLTISAIVNTDNSGNVSFTSAATNAITYEYDFGNGISQIIASGIVTYKYPSSGTYTVNVIAKSAGGQTISKSIQITVTIILSLVWSEEFDVAGSPDATKWGYDLGAGGWGNNEVQYYTNRIDNAAVSNGTLKINLKKETFNGSTYTSARLLSKDKFSFKYGKIEVKAKIPAGGGTWPAIWMLGSNLSTTPWPACGEIDIMEHVGNQLNKIFGTLHHPGHSGANGDGGTVTIPTATTSFHIYTVEWTTSTIKFLVDNATFYTFTNNPALPFNQNFFIILNVAMGGNFGGAVDPSISSAVMEIDYVRVYQ